MTAIEFLEKKLSELEAVERAATPGPWRWSKWHENKSLQVVGPLDELIGEFHYHRDKNDPNANFTYIARNNFAPMIRAIRWALDCFVCRGWKKVVVGTGYTGEYGNEITETQECGACIEHEKLIKEMAREMGWREE